MKEREKEIFVDHWEATVMASMMASMVVYVMITAKGMFFLIHTCTSFSPMFSIVYWTSPSGVPPASHAQSR